jgi:hypothetical protein
MQIMNLLVMHFSAPFCYFGIPPTFQTHISFIYHQSYIIIETDSAVK